MRLIPIALAVVLGLAACAPTPQTAPAAPGKVVPAYYEARTDSGPNGEPIQIAAVKTAYLNERTMRTNVPYNGPEPAGTIVVDPFARVLYYVQPGGMAERYGVAVGAAGKNFAGNGTIAEPDGILRRLLKRILIGVVQIISHALASRLSKYQRR